MYNLLPFQQYSTEYPRRYIFGHMCDLSMGSVCRSRITRPNIFWKFDLENDQIELLEMKKQCHENLKLNHRLNTKQTEQIIPDEESISDLKDRSKEVTRMEHGQNTKNHKRSNSIEPKESKLNIFP